MYLFISSKFYSCTFNFLFLCELTKTFNETLIKLWSYALIIFVIEVQFGADTQQICEKEKYSNSVIDFINYGVDRYDFLNFKRL